MALLEQINSMKGNGMSDTQIVNSLKDSGFSPMDINEALGQSKIKAAISQEIPENIQQSTESGMEGMQASAMSAEEGQNYISSGEQTGAQNIPQYPMAGPMQAPPEQAYYPPEAQAQPVEQYQDQSAAYAYPPQAQEGYYAQGVDLETSKDIAKQEAEEAVKKIRIEISDILKFKSDIKFELQDVQNRLAKVESTMNELQFSVIKKVSDYGEQISGISKEIKMTQDSFSKIIGPFMDKTRGLVKREAEEPEQKTEAPKEEKQKKAKSNSDKAIPEKAPQKRGEKAEPAASFEDYFR